MSRTLLDQWRDIAYDEQADRGQLQNFWGTYFQIEKEIYEKLLSRSIAVRFMGGYLRITAGTKEEHKALFSALEEIAKELSSL